MPVWLNFVYSLFFPLGALLVWNAVVPRLSSSASSSSSSSSRAERYPSSFHRHHNAVLGLAISLILASFLTDVVKNTVGRPRPDLLARCQPAPSTPRDTLVSIDVCTTSSATEHHRLHDGWRSFPSGHSSFAFAGLGYLSLFLAGALRVFRDRRRLWRALVCLAPLVAAALIAIGRCQDYRHDVYDVSVGSVLGFTVAVFAYRRYWPRLDSPMCHLPYPAPGSDDDDNDEFDFDNGNEDGRGAFRRVRARDLEDGPIIGRGPGPITTATAGYDSNELTVFSPPRVLSSPSP